MKGQYEQQCNAAALENIGVSVIKSLKEKHLNKITSWTLSNEFIGVNYLNETKEIIDSLFLKHSFELRKETEEPKRKSRFKNDFKKLGSPALVNN